MEIDEIVIKDIERDCIACPASWSGDTLEDGNIYVRFRGGVLSLRYRGPNEDPINEDMSRKYVSREREIYFDDSFESLDGHMNVFELKNYLENNGVRFENCLDTTFYDGLKPEQCDFLMLGDWFVEAICEEKDWKVDSESVEKIEYETVIPKSCPICGSEIEVETQKPERLEKNWNL